MFHYPIFLLHCRWKSRIKDRRATQQYQMGCQPSDCPSKYLISLCLSCDVSVLTMAVYLRREKMTPKIPRQY